MTEKTLTDARAHLAEAIDAARRDHDPVYITRHGRRIAALIDSDDLDRLIEAAEDLADLRSAQAARAERMAGAEPIPWEQVKADLGLE